MADFQSFEDFQKGLHEQKTAEIKRAERREDVRRPPERLRSRRRRHHRRAGGKKLILCAAGLAAVGLALFVLPIPVGDIRLHGNETISREDILFDGNIASPVNVFQISTSELTERLKKDIRISRAEVSRSFPAYIDVTIEERKPLAAVQEEFGYAFLDREGMVIRTGRSIRGADLPMVTGVKLDNALLGDIADKDSVQMALQFLSGLSAQGLYMFSEINVGNPENIVAYTRDGIAVRLGDGQSMEARAELAENMVNDVKVRGLAVAYIDASLTSPYIKLKK